MSFEIWGPALDAEVAYRTERLSAAARPGLPGRKPRRPRGRRRSTATQAAATRVPAALPTGRPARASERGWPLQGSGAWPAA
jgi:hypothetical protein